MIRVAAFTGGGDVPGARFRVRQYIKALAALDIVVEEMPCRFGKYPPANRLIRPLWLVAALCEQASNLTRLGEYDVVLLQREVVSKLVTIERGIERNALLDVDDAIDLFRKGHVARELAKRASVVVCGNAYLAEKFSAWNSRIEIIPTAVDTERYRPLDEPRENEDLIIGWIGTSSNLRELMRVEAPLGKVLSMFPRAKLRVISNNAPKFRLLKAEQFEFVPWREASEVGDIQGMDIGIMPLQDSDWARGKCAFKMIQYMACGLPSVVSAVGMNSEVARMGDFSFAVRGADGWIDALMHLLRDADRRRLMGRAARRVAENSFSVRTLAPRLGAVIREVSDAL
jgi:glycosyltransferase involved in cell wall biosynthesis